jgi:hypothetical protein
MLNIRPASEQPVGLFNEGLFNIRQGSHMALEGIFNIWRGIITVTNGLFIVFGSFVINASMLLSLLFIQFLIIVVVILIFGAIKFYAYLTGSKFSGLRRSISINNVPSL